MPELRTYGRIAGDCWPTLFPNADELAVAKPSVVMLFKAGCLYFPKILPNFLKDKSFLAAWTVTLVSLLTYLGIKPTLNWQSYPLVISATVAVTLVIEYGLLKPFFSWLIASWEKKIEDVIERISGSGPGSRSELKVSDVEKQIPLLNVVSSISSDSLSIEPLSSFDQNKVDIEVLTLNTIIKIRELSLFSGKDILTSWKSIKSDDFDNFIDSRLSSIVAFYRREILFDAVFCKRKLTEILGSKVDDLLPESLYTDTKIFLDPELKNNVLQILDLLADDLKSLLNAYKNY